MPVFEPQQHTIAPTSEVVPSTETEPTPKIEPIPEIEPQASVEATTGSKEEDIYMDQYLIVQRLLPSDPPAPGGADDSSA